MSDRIKSEIGEATIVLFSKSWGKYRIGNRLRSQSWWQKRLNDIINEPTYVIPPEHLWNGCPAVPAPIPFEIEVNMPSLDYDILFTAWQKIHS